MKYFLGIDGGGTKTAAVIIDETGAELGRGQGGPCNIATCDDETLVAAVTVCVSEAITTASLPEDTRFAGVCAGVAGYTAKKRRAEFLDLLKTLVTADEYRLEPDYVVAYWGATEGEPGIIVSAGTGAVVYGRNEAGQTVRVDGRGFLLGDRGSGFYIGTWALKNVVKALESDSELDEFSRTILEAIGAEDVDDLIEWTYRDFDPGKIASVTAVVGKLAEAGNRRAIIHIEGAAGALRFSVYRAHRLLASPLPGQKLPIYIIGGLWGIGETFVRAFRTGKYFGHQEPPFELALKSPAHDSAYGAAFLAFKEITGNV